MKVTLTNIGKRYNTEWIFRNVNHEFDAGQHCVILGGNGSGKSTLLQVIAGNLMASAGDVTYSLGNTRPENIYSRVSFASPYLDLFEEYTLKEAAGFHVKFKPFFKDISTENFIALTGLEKAADKQLKYYSSGMKQRVRLALAILSDTPLLLLDEPASNLDKKAIDWYQQLVNDHSNNRLIIVCSNQQQYEYSFCTKELNIEDYKK
jgi:ABC-type multidrug transport system ATPase subunit